MPNTAISARQLVKSFGEGDAKTYAVRSVDFDACFGEVFYLVGPSGSGKTSLLSMISGILKPDAGSVLIDKTDIWSLGKDQLADFRLNRIGFVFQDYHLFPRLTTVENVAIPLILKRRDWDESIREAMDYLDVVGLKGRAYLPPVKLSGGEQQRVAIARAMVSQPDILIFDEPTASLDGDSGRKIMTFVKTNIVNEKRCILVVTHDNRIFEYADRIMKMEDGVVTAIENKIKMLQTFKFLLLILLLSACSTMPSGPSVLVLPGTGKNLNQFHKDDLMCRQLAHEQVATSQEEPDSKEEGQQHFDIIYIQCMYSKGHRVPVPGQLMYDTQQEWHSPPPPDMPAPPQPASQE